MLYEKIDHTEAMTFRPATVYDSGLLLEWRNDPLTRESSINTDVVSAEEHLRWFGLALKDPQRRILIAVIDSVPVGMVRADSKDGYTELSWAVSPIHRGRGIGALMVAEAVKMFYGRLTARIKNGNPASMTIAERAGFTKERVEDGITYWSRGPHQACHG